MMLTVFLVVTTLAACASPTKYYSVFFLVKVDSAGEISSLQVVQVRDINGPGSGPVQITVPDSYVAAARAFLSKRAYKGPNQFVTYTFYDPSQPSRADVNPHANRQQ
jgi:hypothetical protein